MYIQGARGLDPESRPPEVVPWEPCYWWDTTKTPASCAISRLCRQPVETVLRASGHSRSLKKTGCNCHCRLICSQLMIRATFTTAVTERARWIFDISERHTAGGRITPGHPRGWRCSSRRNESPLPRSSMFCIKIPNRHSGKGADRPLVCDYGLPITRVEITQYCDQINATGNSSRARLCSSAPGSIGIVRRMADTHTIAG